MNYRFQNSRGRRIPESSASTSSQRRCAQLKLEHALLAHLAGVLIMVTFVVGLTGTIALTLRTMLHML